MPNTPGWADRISWIALVVAGAAGLLSLSLAWPPTDASLTDALTWLAAGVGLVGAVIAGGFDLRWRRVPNALTLSLILAALVLAGVHLFVGDWGPNQLGALALAWAVCLTAWLARLFGGGDAKLGMGLLALFPTWAGAFWIALGVLVGGAVYLQWGRHRGGWGRAARAVWLGLGRRALAPRSEIDEAYRARSQPAAPWIAVGFCAFVCWAIWPLAL